jgi:hypothetical protein
VSIRNKAIIGLLTVATLLNLGGITRAVFARTASETRNIQKRQVRRGRRNAGVVGHSRTSPAGRRLGLSPKRGMSLAGASDSALLTFQAFRPSEFTEKLAPAAPEVRAASLPCYLLYCTLLI